MSIKKQILKTKPVCKATFTLTAEEVGDAETVHIVGDFNDWDETADPLKKLKNGSFKIALNLEQGKKYQFKYLIDGKEWINESEADLYIPNSFSGENSVIFAE